MINQMQMLDRIQELRSFYTDAEVVFLINGEECCENSTYTQQKISSVSFDKMYIVKKSDENLILIGKEEILDYLSGMIYDEELKEIDGVLENIKSDEDIDLMTNAKYENDKAIKGTIIVKFDA
jgi:hypothetical protein